MKLRSFLSPALSLSASVLLAVSVAATAQAPTGKIHGKVTDPTGVPKTTGTVSLSTDGGKTLKYNFPVDGSGNFTGADVPPGTYTMVFRTPEMAEGKVADQLDNIKIAAGEDLAQDDDMSRKEYLDRMTPDQRKEVEEFKKKNADVMKNNSVIKNLNADLNQARSDNHDKKYADAETLMLKDTALKQDSDLLWFELGNAQMGLKKWDDAASDFKKAVDLSTASKKPSPELIGGAHAALGEVDARNNKAPDAESEYDLAAKANPAKSELYYSNEAVVFSQVSNTDGQAAAADKAIAADPKNPLPYYLKGQALIGKASMDPKTNQIVLPPGCGEAYQKYLELAPDGPYANDVKGILAQSNAKVETKFKAKK